MSGASERIKTGNESIINTISPIMNEKGVPSYIWLPIVARESGFNPDSLLSNSEEYSKGLFQINLKAHPQYIGTNLADPVINTTIARDVFIAPAYEYAKKLTNDPREQALIVYSGLKNPESLDTGAKKEYLPDGVGIRPKWTVTTRDAFLGYYEQYKGLQVGQVVGNTATVASTGGGGISFGGTTTTTGGSGSVLDLVKPAPVVGGGSPITITPEGQAGIQAVQDSQLTSGQGWLRVGFVVGLILVILIAGFVIVSKNPVTQVLKYVKGGNTSNE